RHGKLRVARRRHYRRAQKHDRIGRAARDQGNDAPGFAERISNGGISRRARINRHDRASEKNARDHWSLARVFLFRVVKYKEALAWLYSLQRFGIKLGLENIQRLIAELEVNLGNARVIHVAGTNGKGSVCAMIDSICRAQKHRTGLFTSPHLITFRERIRVNGEMISKSEVAAGLTNIRKLVADWEP